MDKLLPTLRRRLQDSSLALPRDFLLEPLPTTGLAHDHIRIHDTGLLLRIPKQSQLGLSAEANLHYQSACFRRTETSGHTPRLHLLLEPDESLPMGALVVDEIPGQVLQLPGGLHALADALAAIHGLPVPPEAQRPPLKNPANMVGDTVDEVLAQATYLKAADLHPDAQREIRREIASAREMVSMPYHPPPVLISFDAHPGNFLTDTGGRAFLVDLEKARYGLPGLDLAHATLYTSTTWDVATYAVLDIEQITEFYRRWLTRVPAELADASKPWLLPLRRIMWLWSVTWCAKWRVQSREAGKADKHRQDSTEDWSAELSDPALVRHVAERVDDYLHPNTVTRVRDEWLNHNALTKLLQG